MLKHSEVPETEALQRTIQRLRAELATAKSSRHQPDRQQSGIAGERTIPQTSSS